MNSPNPSPPPVERSVAQFFFEVGYGACFAEVMIRNGMKPPFELSDAHIEEAWPRSIEAHEDGAEMDRYLALADVPLPEHQQDVVEKPYLVFSWEHNAFWRPNECGYTRFIERAGRYSQERAEAICRSAGYHNGPQSRKDEPPAEICFPAPEASMQVPELPKWEGE